MTNNTIRSSTTEHLIINYDCANNYKLLKFRVINGCSYLINFVRLVVFFSNISESCKRKNFIIKYKHSTEQFLLYLVK